MLVLRAVVIIFLLELCAAHKIRDRAVRRPGLRLRQRLSAAVRNRNRSAGQICYDNVGCFDLPHPRSPLQKSPQDPDTIDTKFYLFNRNIEFSRPDILYVNDDHISLLRSRFEYKKPLKVLIHGYMGTWGNIYNLNATNAYLKLYDCNVIIVNWSNGAKGPQYAVAAANTEVVGRQLGILLNDLVNEGLSPKQIHLIGFSLGAHIAACASEWLKSKGMLVSRITGLDAAGPLFRHSHLRERSKKLDREDAVFVDALHTDSSPVFVDGFGLWEPIGHVDFFANGGKDQPGCTDRHPSIVVTHFDKTLTLDTACSHTRAFALFLEALIAKSQNDECKFIAYECPGGLPSFEKGQCFPKLPNPNDTLTIDPSYRGDLGLFGEDVKGNGVMYFATRDSGPFCGSQVQTMIRLSPQTPPTLGVLTLELDYDHDRPKFEILCDLTDLVTRNTVLNKIGATKYKSLNPNLKKMQVLLKFSYYDSDRGNQTQLFPKEVVVEDVRIIDMYGNSWQYYGKKVTLSDHCKQEGVAMLLKKSK